MSLLKLQIVCSSTMILLECYNFETLKVICVQSGRCHGVTLVTLKEDFFFTNWYSFICSYHINILFAFYVNLQQNRLI